MKRLSQVLQRPSIVELILERLRDEILSGEYKPGTALPPERELADRYGVNRTSVKHALMKLESVGMIDIKHGVGSLVADYAERGGAAVLEYLLATEEIDHKLLEDALEVRVSIGAEIAKLAAKRAQPSTVSTLQDLANRVAAAKDEPMKLQALDMELFEMLTDATGNRAFKLIVNSVSAAYLPQAPKLAHGFTDTTAAVAGVRAIVDAVAKGDANAARDAAEAHLSKNSQAMLAGLTPKEDQ